MAEPPVPPDSEAAAPDLPATMSLFQPHSMYADLTELRHFSAYNAFHAARDTNSSGSSSAAPAAAACFGNQ